MITKEERVLRIINREEVDYLPSQIIFADRSRNLLISKALGLSSVSELDDYLENHLYFTSTLQDMPLYAHDSRYEMNKLHKKSFCYPDWENKVVYDNWGLGIQVDLGSFNVSFNPLNQKAKKEVLKFMPPNISSEAIFAKDFETAIKKYEVPNINKRDNFSKPKEDLKKYSVKYLVVPSGHNGILERSFYILGLENFMENIALKPKVIEELLDKVTEYKVEFAKKIVSLGFKVAHHGDDFGTQRSTLFSKDMFKKLFIPRLKMIWEVFNNANIPIMLHSCGKITEFLPDLIEIGLKILEPVQPCMDLKYLKKEFGKDLIFFGGIDTQQLPFITPEETKEMVRHAIRTLGKGGGMIIAPSQAIMNDVPLENVKALIEAIKDERAKII